MMKVDQVGMGNDDFEVDESHANSFNVDEAIPDVGAEGGCTGECIPLKRQSGRRWSQAHHHDLIGEADIDEDV